MPRVNDLDDVTCCLRRRANKAQWGAWSSFISAFAIAIIAIAVVVMVFSNIMTLIYSEVYDPIDPFDYYDNYNYTLPEGLTPQETEVLNNYIRLQINISSTKDELREARDKEERLSRSAAAKHLALMKRKLDGEMKNNKIIMFSSLVGVASLSSIALCLYVLQFLIHLARYFLTLSRHFEIVSDAVVVSGLRDLDKVARLMNSYASTVN